MVSSTTSPASDVTIARVHLRSVRLLFLHLFPFLFSCFYLIFASFATSCAAAASSSSSSSSSFLQFVRVVGLSGRVFASLNLCCILWLLTLLSTVVDSGFAVFDSLSLSLSLSLSRAAAAVRCSSRGYDEPFIVEKKVRINIQPSKDLMVYYYQRTRPCKEGMRAIECHILSNLLASEAIV